ncbi:FHA domain-containing protein [Acidovorax sp. SRB_24]|uniref:FHA domain-containing protein n=1 Tax=Acidovorax sp. SRB_24 TaxID=1962700 RepID=UPI00145F3AB9|nr:FHA domain-containing protein [Acidovorax sp. SRB_24]NMM78963.1 FHA domain-containing protein [Acidovorax sp. SRB_24]
MPKLILSIDGVAIKEIELTKERTTLGRRPYNDIVIDHLAVSGEHAVLHMLEAQAVEIEDLNSTNGTYVNGKAIGRQLLRHGDTVELSKYKIRFLDEAEAEGYETTVVVKHRMASAPRPLARTVPAAAAASPAVIRVLTGPAAGREVALTKVVTTIGKPGVAVASITRRHQGFVLAHVEGPELPRVNGAAVENSAAPLQSGDRLELAGTQMQFVQGVTGAAP